jgi:hypothetical protein
VGLLTIFNAAGYGAGHGRVVLGQGPYRPSLLGGFLASTGLDFTPFCNPQKLEIISGVGGDAGRQNQAISMKCRASAQG